MRGALRYPSEVRQYILRSPQLPILSLRGMLCKYSRAEPNIKVGVKIFGVFSCRHSCFAKFWET